MPHTPLRVVKIEVDVIASAGDTKIVCTPESADVTKDTNHVLLVFTLNTTGFRFPATDAIVVDFQADDETPAANFPFPSWTISDTQATLYDNNKTARAFGYTVNVLNNSTGAPYKVDPLINNGGGGSGAAGC
jgi:hypothetical protein